MKRRTACRLLLSLPVWTLCAAGAWAEDAQTSVADLISKLSSQDAEQVNRARDRLIALEEKAVDELENYQSDNQKVSAQIKVILNRICNYYIRIDPKREKDITSPGGNGIEVMLSIKNNSEGPVKLYWIDRTGGRVPYKDIKAGDEIKQRSFESHCWIIVDKDSKALGIYRATYQSGRILVQQKFF
ncbi:MAG: hypothetical protein VB835_08850 [Pirellulales bacterium]